MSGRSTHDGQQLSASLTLGLGLLAATVTLLTAGSIGVLGFVLGKQQTQSSKKSKSSMHESDSESDDPFNASKGSKSKSKSPRRLRVPSGTASEDVRISDKKAIVDVRITGIRPLIPPACLLEEIPLSSKMAQTVRSFAFVSMVVCVCVAMRLTVCVLFLYY